MLPHISSAYPPVRVFVWVSIYFCGLRFTLARRPYLPDVVESIASYTLSSCNRRCRGLLQVVRAVFSCDILHPERFRTLTAYPWQQQIRLLGMIPSSVLATSNRSGGKVPTVAPSSSCTDIHLFSKDERESPAHIAPRANLGSMFEFGRALGYQKFEIVSLAGREAGEINAAHAQQMDNIPDAIRNELQREVERLRDRAENLSRELTFAREDSRRLTELLKKEEGVGREQRRRADEATREARKLKEELDTLKQTRTSTGSSNTDVSLQQALRAEAKSALSDAHGHSEMMTERRRRQQAESMMHAYKDLYEKELKIQHASMESYRSLSNGYSRLLGEVKELKRKIAVFAAGPAACSRTPVGRKADETEDPSTAMVPAGAVVGAALDRVTSLPEKYKPPRGLTWRRCGTSSGDVAVGTGGSSSTVAGTPESFGFSNVDVVGASLTCGLPSPTKCESPPGLT